MKKRAISLFLVISMSFTFFYPELALNDNVLEIEDNDEFLSLTKLLRSPRGEREFKLKIIEWLNEICR